MNVFSAVITRIAAGILAVLLIPVLAAAGPAAGELAPLDRAAAERISFRHDVWPIVKRHCLACHSGAGAKGSLRLDSVADMLTGGDSGPLFTPGQPDESLLVRMTAGPEPEMPKRQPPLSAQRLAVLRGWILAGAKDDSPAGPAPESPPQIPAEYRFAPAVTSVAIHPDGKLLAAACRSELVLIAADTDEPVRRLPTRCDLLTHVEFSPDGSLVAVSGGSPARFGEVRFYRVADGSLAGERRLPGDTLFRGRFAPAGQSIALGGADGAVYVVPVDPAAAVRRIELHSDWVLDVAWSPDGKLLVSGGRDKAVKVASAETGKLIRAIDASTDLISCVAASEQFAVAAGKARQLVAYELKTALEGVEITGGGNDARPVNKRDQYARPFEAQPDEVFALATSADRQLLAVAGGYGEVRVYKLADRQRAALISAVPPPVYAVALSADGSRLALGTKSGLVQLYELPAGKLLKSLVPVPLAGAIAGQ